MILKKEAVPLSCADLNLIVVNITFCIKIILPKTDKSYISFYCMICINCIYYRL